jgi:antitoxin VapB
MSLNIKNPGTYRLVKELAELTGESMTAAVTEAVRERLERLRQSDSGIDVERALALAAEIGRRMPPGYLDQDFDELLYDERGLPR